MPDEVIPGTDAPPQGTLIPVGNPVAELRERPWRIVPLPEGKLEMEELGDSPAAVRTGSKAAFVGREIVRVPRIDILTHRGDPDEHGRVQIGKDRIDLVRTPPVIAGFIDRRETHGLCHELGDHEVEGARRWLGMPALRHMKGAGHAGEDEADPEPVPPSARKHALLLALA